MAKHSRNPNQKLEFDMAKLKRLERKFSVRVEKATFSEEEDLINSNNANESYQLAAE